MSDDTSPLARWLQEVLLASKRCLAGEPCGSDECDACIYGKGVSRTLMPSTWRALDSWAFEPKDYSTATLTVYPLTSDDSFGAPE